MATKETKSQLLQDFGDENLQIEENTTMVTITPQTEDITGYEAIEIDTPTADTMDATIEMEPQPLSRTRSLSDKLNRSAPILFLKNHGEKLIGKQDSFIHEDRDKSWTNWVVGVSCACFLMPTITIIILQMWNTVRICIIFDAIYFIIVAICSFLSDYVYCYVKDTPCGVKFETIDQWTATGGVLIVIISIIIYPYPLIFRFTDFLILLFAVYLIGKSRSAANKHDNGKSWRKWHSIWHVFAGCGLSYIYVQEYLLKTGVIKGHDWWWPW